MTDTAFETACGLIRSVLEGPARREIVAGAGASSDHRQALRRLDAPIQALDRRVRDDGFHVLHDWDGKAGRVNTDTIALNVLDYAIEKAAPGPANTNVLAILGEY